MWNTIWRTLTYYDSCKSLFMIQFAEMHLCVHAINKSIYIQYKYNSYLSQKCSSFWKCLYFGIHLSTVAPSVCWFLWFGKPCWKWSQRFSENKISFAYYHFQQNNFHEIYIFLFFKWTIQRLLKAIAWNWYSVKL